MSSNIPKIDQTSPFVSAAIRTIDIECDSIKALRDQIDDGFESACELIMNCRGRVVVSGMGKSGHIGNKIAATLASTGTPAFFVHPGEASHGDMGMITADDVVIALSNSGSTHEIVSLLPLIKRLGVKLISITGNPNSALATAADARLNVAILSEACPLGLAPTSSTTAALVMGDALAVALLEAKGFTAEDFAFSHPGGALGRKLLLKVEDLMQGGDRMPVVSADTSLKQALIEISAKGMGMTTIADDTGVLLGIFTDGDLRRSFEQNIDLDGPIASAMTRSPKTIQANMLAAEALRIMEDNSVSALVVVNAQQQAIAVLHLHELLKAGLA